MRRGAEADVCGGHVTLQLEGAQVHRARAEVGWGRHGGLALRQRGVRRWGQSWVGQRDTGGVRSDRRRVGVGHAVRVHDGVRELLQFGQAEGGRGLRVPPCAKVLAHALIKSPACSSATALWDFHDHWSGGKAVTHAALGQGLLLLLWRRWGRRGRRLGVGGLLRRLLWDLLWRRGLLLLVGARRPLDDSAALRRLDAAARGVGRRRGRRRLRYCDTVGTTVWALSRLLDVAAAAHGELPPCGGGRVQGGSWSKGAAVGLGGR